MEYHLSALRNGITVLKVPKSDSESVSVNFFVKIGSRDEMPKIRGISHFLEHLLFKGTKRYPTAKILSTTVEAIGADYNAATSKEYTVFYIKAAKTHLPLIFDVLCDMLLHPILNPEEIEREKGVIIEEMNMYRDTPMRYVGELLEEQMWPNSDIGAQIIGDEKTVNCISKTDITNYLASQYINRNLILAIAGKYNDHELDKLIDKYWRRGIDGPTLAATPAPKKALTAPVRVHSKKTEQAHMALGFYSFDYNHPENFVLDVLSNIMGGWMSSRLFSEIRERRGLAYYVRMGTSHYLDCGVTGITAGLRLGKVEEALDVASRELRKIKKTLVAGKELKKAKENMKGRMTLALEDNEARLEWYLEQTAFHKKTLSPAAAFRRIDAVTPRQIQALDKRLFRRDNMKLALIGPYQGRERAFSKLLKF